MNQRFPAKFDFLNLNLVLKYFFLTSFALFAGYHIRDSIALLAVTAILGFCLSKNIYRCIEIALIWFFIYEFFIGQNCFSIEFIHKYISKPSFLFLLLFIFFADRVPSKIFKSSSALFLVLFVLITFLSSVINSQSPFAVISAIPFFTVYFLLQAKGITQKQYSNLLNLFVAIALLQTVVSLLQVTEIIPPPTKMMGSSDGTKYKWEAGLDDVASGTFGAASSFNTSWYAALVSLFMLIMWALTKRKSYLIIMAISFFQFAMVDSKIILFVTVIMFSFFMLSLYRNRSKFKVNFGKFIYIVTILIIGSFGFYTAWDSYYNYYGNKNTGYSRTGVKSILDNEILDTKETVLENIGNWGKINGFQHIFKDFVENDPTQLIFGYGIQGYENYGKMGYIESKDVIVMQTNNFTNSRSGLITQFAISGLVGIIFLCLSIGLWYKDNKAVGSNNFSLLKKNLLHTYLPFSFFAAFLYTISINCIPLIAFSAIIAIYSNLERMQAPIHANVDSKVRTPIKI